MHLSALREAVKGILLLATICILLVSPALGQMRQMYLDADPANPISKISFYSPNEGYVAFAKWVGYTVDSGRTYTKRPVTISNVNYGAYANINLTFGFDIQGVKAFDKNTLIVYGDYGLVPAILYSSDGGNSYALVFYSQFDPLQLRTGIRDVVFPQNDNIGYAVDADRILKTTDKGVSWTVQTIMAGSYFDHLEAVDDNNLIAISTDFTANKIVKTANGGSSWSRLTYPRSGTMTYAYFLDANTGWLSMYGDGQSQCFYKTTNGGGAWTLQNDVDATPFNCDKMRFVDGNTGYALVAPYQVYKTSNSGVTWEPLARDNTYSYLGYTSNDLQCLPPLQLWAGGDHGFLEMTTNGGSPLPAAYFKVDTTNLYATGIVQLLNYSRTGYQYQWYVNKVLISSDYNSTYTHDISRSADTVQLVVTAGGVSDTLTKYPQFYNWGVAKPASYFPKTGSSGTFVTISGSSFSNISGVSFGGTAAASFSILSDTVVTAVVASGATGPITLKQFYGTVSVGPFNYSAPSSSAPPVIQEVAPLAGVIGTTVTITGGGFNAIPAQNGVFFGSVPAKVQSASSGQLVCTVPAGASLGTIRVLNRGNGLSGESTLSFNVSFADSVAHFTPNSFVDGYIVNKGAGLASGVQGKDIDGDGKPDLLVNITAGQGDSLVVLRNTTSGGRLSFAPRVNIGYQFFPTFGHFAVNDLDGDGLPDVVIETNDRYVKALRNRSSPGTISFDNEYRIPTGSGTQNVVITDLDNDGKNDIAVTAFSDKCISVVRNTSIPGALSFGVTQNFPAPATVTGIAAGDLDGDGLKDVVVYSAANSGSLLLYRNTSVPGAISFAACVGLNVPGQGLDGSYISIVDFDGDGKLDIVICNEENICVFQNNGTAGNFSFLPPVTMRLEQTQYFTDGWGGCVSNFSGSARPDIISATGGPFRHIIMDKNSSRTGSVALDSLVYGPGDNSSHIFPQAVGGADFDGDGKTDLVASSLSDNMLIIYKNTVNVPVVIPMCTTKQGGNALVSDISGSSYQWQQDSGSGFGNVVDNVNLSGGTSNTLNFINTPVSWNGYKYRCLVGGRYSSTFVLQLNHSADPGVMVTATDSAICYGNTVNFTATDSTGYNYNYFFQWQINGKDTGYIFSNQLSASSLRDQDQVRVILSYIDICQGQHTDTSRAITMHVNGTLATVQISASDSGVCVGTPITFTAVASNPGSTPTYDWQVNNVSQGINNAAFTSSALRNGDAVQVLMKSSVTCAYPMPARSNIIAASVKDTSALSVSLSASANSVCEGTNVVFSATPVNAGTSSVYQWLVNGIDSGVSANTWSTSSLHDKDVVQCILTSPAICRQQNKVSSNTIVMTVNSTLAPAISLSASDTAICIEDGVIFTAQPVNQGPSPVYQWTSNGIITGTNSPTYTIGRVTENKTVTVSLKSSIACASPDTVTSLPVSVTAYPIPKITISGDTLVAPGVQAVEIAALSSTVQAPAFQWQDSTRTHSWLDITGATEGTITYLPVTSGDKLRCVCISHAGCTAASNSLAVRINVPTATTSTPPTGGTDTYRWYPNPVSSTLYIENIDPWDAMTSVTIFSLSGSRVLALSNNGNQVKLAINVSRLDAGEYLVNLVRRSGNTSHFVFLKL